MTKSAPVLSEKWLVVGFASVALWSLASSVYSQRSLVEVHSQAESLLSHALPGIDQLTTMRASLRHLDIAFDHFLATGSSPDRTELEETIRELDRAATAYLALPSFPGERALWTEAALRMDEMKQSLWRAVADRAGSAPAAISYGADPVHRVVGQVDKSVHGLVLFNVQQAHAVVVRSEAALRRSELVPLVIDALGLGLAGVVALFGVRAIRRYTRYRVEHERLLALRADELEQFAARVAHDIRNPLSGVSLVLGSLRWNAEKGSAQFKLAERGVAAMTRVSRIIEGLYDFACAGARPQPGAKASVVAALTDAVAEVRQKAAETLIEVRIAPIGGPCLEGQPKGDAEVACSPGILAVLISNLIHNSVKYMSDGPVRTITARVVRRSGRVRVEIEDTGAGIPLELQGTIFEPYVRAPNLTQPGIGLGLATVKRIVLAHGGTVGLRSAPGRGSLLWFELPAASGQQHQTIQG